MFYLYFILDDGLFCPVGDQWDAYIHQITVTQLSTHTHTVIHSHRSTKIFHPLRCRRMTSPVGRLSPSYPWPGLSTNWGSFDAWKSKGLWIRTIIYFISQWLRWTCTHSPSVPCCQALKYIHSSHPLSSVQDQSNTWTLFILLPYISFPFISIKIFSCYF